MKDRPEFLVANIEKNTKQQTPAEPLQDMRIVDMGYALDITIICAPLSPALLLSLFNIFFRAVLKCTMNRCWHALWIVHISFKCLI